jgi:hypothetical protein
LQDLELNDNIDRVMIDREYCWNNLATGASHDLTEQSGTLLTLLLDLFSPKQPFESQEAVELTGMLFNKFSECPNLEFEREKQAPPNEARRVYLFSVIMCPRIMPTCTGRLSQYHIARVR